MFISVYIHFYSSHYVLGSTCPVNKLYLFIVLFIAYLAKSQHSQLPKIARRNFGSLRERVHWFSDSRVIKMLRVEAFRLCVGMFNATDNNRFLRSLKTPLSPREDPSPRERQAFILIVKVSTSIGHLLMTNENWGEPNNVPRHFPRCIWAFSKKERLKKKNE